MKAFITITGLKFHFGSKPFEVGQKVKLVKEPDNEYDSEAIKAELPGLGCAGYVANSPHTVLGDCISAGRLYDKIGDSATAKVVYVLDNAVVCKVKIAEKEKMCNLHLTTQKAGCYQEPPQAILLTLPDMRPGQWARPG